jgi:hypothetical protein
MIETVSDTMSLSREQDVVDDNIEKKGRVHRPTLRPMALSLTLYLTLCIAVFITVGLFVADLYFKNDRLDQISTQISSFISHSELNSHMVYQQALVYEKFLCQQYPNMSFLDQNFIDRHLIEIDLDFQNFEPDSHQIDLTFEEILKEADDYDEVSIKMKEIYSKFSSLSLRRHMLILAMEMKIATRQVFTSITPQLLFSSSNTELEVIAYLIKEVTISILRLLADDLDDAISFLKYYIIFVVVLGSAVLFLLLTYLVYLRFFHLLKSISDFRSLLESLPPELVLNNAYATNFLKDS